MQAKQVFCAYKEKDDGDFGQFKYCPFCETQLEGAPVDPDYAVAER